MKKRIHNIAEWFLSKKLKQKVRYLFIGIIGIYLILFGFTYMFYLRGHMSAYMEQSSYNTVSLVNSNFNGEIQNINTMTQLLMTHPDIVRFLRGEGSSREAEEGIRGISINFSNISSVYVFDNGNEYARITNNRTTLNEEAMDREWHEAVSSKAGGYLLKVNGGGVFKKNSGEVVLTLLRIINDVETQQPIGILAVNCSHLILENTFVDLQEEGREFAYFDEHGEVIYSSQPELFSDREVSQDRKFEMQSETGRNIYYYYNIADSPLIIAGVEPFYYGEDFMSGYAWGIILLLILITAASLIIIGFFISFSITGPIEKLVVSMDNTKKGWLKRVSMNLPDDEIGHLKDSYNNMLVEINRLIAELVEEEKSRQKAELLMLQEQIKPHFLYNTLDTIAFMSLENTADETYDAIETLGNFYRGFLSKGSNEISVAEEVTIVKNYLKLQKLRYEDVFEDEYQIEESLWSHRIPKLVIQPLVENSLYHGVRLKGEPGIIRVSIYADEEWVYISVYDTGVGMSADKIRNFQSESNGKSFGLKATVERIKYYYNQEDVFMISSEEGKYCEVIIKIPLLWEGKHV